MSKGKKIFCIILAIFLGALAFGTVSTIFANDSKSAGAIFKVGGLDPETGKYVKEETTIYTEKAFDCYGLRVEPDFESTVTYDIYYYDDNDVLMKTVLGLSDVYDENFEIAAKCRIVIHPEIPDDTDIDDFKIWPWNVVKYASQLDITVAETPDRNVDYTNLWDGNEGTADASIDTDIFTVSGEGESDNVGYLVSPVIELDKGVDGLLIGLNVTYPPDAYPYVYLADADGNVIKSANSSAKLVDDDGWLVFDISENLSETVVYARVKIFAESTNTVYVYSYND